MNAPTKTQGAEAILLREDTGNICVLTLNRPAARNSLSEALIGALKSGFYVTEVFGQGVNMITGEYSRGASGFWIENGALTYPVSEVTIASNLKDMFLRMVPANDLDRNYGTASPTLLMEGLTLAGS